MAEYNPYAVSNYNVSDLIYGTDIDAVSKLAKQYSPTAAGSGFSFDLSKLGKDLGIMNENGDLLGLSESGWDNIGLALNAYDQFFGTGADIRDAQLDMYGTQKDLLKQQLASNKEALANRRTFNKNWATASNNVMGGGLAANAVS